MAYSKEAQEIVDCLIGWALDEDHAAFEPGWLDERLGIEGATQTLMDAIDKETADRAAAREVYVVIDPEGEPEEWHVEVLDSAPKWNTYGQVVRVADVNGGDSAPVYPQPGTAHRADVTRRLAEAFGYQVDNRELGTEKAMLDVFSYITGIVNEYRDGGDQMVESYCVCQVGPGGHRILNPVCPEHGVNS